MWGNSGMAASARKRTSLAWHNAGRAGCENAVVTRRKGKATARMHERDCPHLVELAHPPNGFGLLLAVSQIEVLIAHRNPEMTP